MRNICLTFVIHNVSSLHILGKAAVDPAERVNVAQHATAEELQATQSTPAGEEDSHAEEEEQVNGDEFVLLLLTLAIHHDISKSGVDDLLDHLCTVRPKKIP